MLKYDAVKLEQQAKKLPGSCHVQQEWWRYAQIVQVESKNLDHIECVQQQCMLKRQTACSSVHVNGTGLRQKCAVKMNRSAIALEYVGFAVAHLKHKTAQTEKEL